jgi:hypothetical protein
MWVLILVLSTSGGDGLSMQAFNTKEACSFALKSAKVLHYKATGVCVPKGRR